MAPLRERASGGFLTEKSHPVEIEYLAEVGSSLFRIRGTLVLRSNSSYPYIIINATLLNGGHQVENAEYMLIEVDPGKKHSFEVSKDVALPVDEYYCILEVSSPFSVLFSEKRQCLAVQDSVYLSIAARKDISGKTSGLDYLAHSKSGSSSFEIQSANGTPYFYENTVGGDAAPISYGYSSQGDSAGDVKSTRIGPKEESSSGLKSDPFLEESGQTALNTEILSAQVDREFNAAYSNSSKSRDKSANSMNGVSGVKGIFVGSTSSNKYHRPDCRYAIKIKNKIYFLNAVEAQKKGKSPCKVCNPS